MLPAPPRCDAFMIIRMGEVVVGLFSLERREGWIGGRGGTHARAVNAVALVALGPFADYCAVRVGFFVVFDVAGS